MKRYHRRKSEEVFWNLDHLTLRRHIFFLTFAPRATRFQMLYEECTKENPEALSDSDMAPGGLVNLTILVF